MSNILKDQINDEKIALSDLYDDVFSDESDMAEPSSLDYLSSQEERYEIEDEIGHGGAKKIIRVYDTRARRYLAMALPRSKSGSSDHNSFIHESWLTAQLDHPNIIKIHEVGVNKDHLPFFTMDLKNGHSLEQILKYLANKDAEYIERFPLTKLLDFFIKICDAISYAHSINILHLDLKPANIQIGQYGEVVVCDWGLAKIIGGRKSLNLHRDMLELDLVEDESPLIMGTPGYMAPEQVAGQAPTPLTDVYGLSAILYHLVTLTPTINTEGCTQALEHTAVGKIQAANELADISDGLSSIIMKGLRVDPTERYQSVLALQSDLSKYLQGYVTKAEDPSVIKEALFFYRRNKMICLQACFFVFLIVASTMGFIASLQQSWKSEQEARIQAEESALKRKQALDLYLKEKAQGAEVKNNFADVLLWNYQIYNSKNFTKNPETMLLNALKGLEYKLEQDPNDSPSQMRMALTLFILQRYEQVPKFMGSQTELKIIEGALKYAADFQYSKGHKNVPLPVFVAVIKGLREFGHSSVATAYRAIAYDIKTRDNFDDYEQVIEEALKLWNDHWENKVFDYNREAQSLRIKGKNFLNLGIYDQFGQIPLLQYIPIQHLDISDTDFEDLHYLAGSQIETLDIRHTKVKDLSPLLKLPELRRIILTQGQFPQEALETLPKTIELNFSK